MQHRQREEEEMSLLEKKIQKEVARKEFTDDLKFKTTLGNSMCVSVSRSSMLMVLLFSVHEHQLRMSIVPFFSPNHRREMNSSQLEEW